VGRGYFGDVLEETQMKTITPGTPEFKKAMEKCKGHHIDSVGAPRSGYEYTCRTCQIRWERRPDPRSQ